LPPESLLAKFGKHKLRTLLRLSRPLYILLAALTYCFGVSIANYLGRPFRADAFWLGLAGVVLTQMSMSLLSEVFRLDAEPLSENETRRERSVVRNNALYVSVSAITVDGVIAFLLYRNLSLSPASFSFLLLSLVLLLAYALPPFRNRGFGEFLLAVQLGYIFPSIAYLLQADVMHRFLALLLPLTLLGFAYFIVLDFPTYASDRKYGRSTILTRLGWERVVPLHHIFVIFAYVFFAISPALGISLSLLWPAFLTLPFALFQIFQVRGISLGAPANWPLLTATALAVFGLTVYLLTLTFWLR
jgi:1,4-dihydroxy-2-naphthoate octaprenyltransferase